MDQKLQKYLAVLILALIIAAIVLSITIPVWKANNHYSNIIDDMTHRLAILKRTTVEGQSLEPQYERLKRYHLSDKRYLKSTSNSLAAAEIQQLIKSIIVPTDGEILSTQIINKKSDDPIRQITLKVRLRGSLSSLVTILYKIETGNPYLFIEDLNIRSRIINRRRLRNRDVEQSPAVLDVQFNVSGYIRGDE
ncbi:MAG: type II secretion system protein GspM [Chromatiales bacterium]